MFRTKVVEKIKTNCAVYEKYGKMCKAGQATDDTIIIRMLMWKYIRANAGASDMGTINSSDRIAATLCCLGTWFVSGIYV
jgi:hypothetical protein